MCVCIGGGGVGGENRERGRGAESLESFGCSCLAKAVRAPQPAQPPAEPGKGRAGAREPPEERKSCKGLSSAVRKCSFL